MSNNQGGAVSTNGGVEVAATLCGMFRQARESTTRSGPAVQKASQMELPWTEVGIGLQAESTFD